jgi:uncharacterized membrane protein YcjF (UPF0283 family)
MIESWILPITLIPGVALLMVSTSSLSIALSDEITRLINTTIDDDKDIIEKKISQLQVLSKAMIAFYISIASFALSAIISGFKAAYWNSAEDIGSGFLFIGIIILLSGSGMLINYSVKAVRIKREQFTRKTG